MNPNPSLLLALSSPAAAGPAAISLTDALLLLSFGGLLVAAYQLNRVLQRLAAIERRLEAVPVRNAAPVQILETPAENGDLPPHVVAAITAACFVEMGESARVVSIRSEDDSKRVWSLEGRRQIFASHQVR